MGLWHVPLIFARDGDFSGMAHGSEPTAIDTRANVAGFKLELAKMRVAGGSQAGIDAMLGRFEELYATDDDEGKLVVAVLRTAAQPPS